MLMIQTKGGTAVLDWRGWNKKDPEKLYRELCRHGRELLEACEQRERELAESLLAQAETENRDIPTEAYRGLMAFRNQEYLRSPGMLSRLYLTGENWQEKHPLSIDGESALARFTEYAAVLKTEEV
jgi:hypothetical protein